MGENNYNGVIFDENIQNLIDILPYFIMIVDEDHNILFANKTTLEALNKDQQSIRGCYCPELVHGLDHPFPGCPLEEALDKGHSVEKDLLDPFYKSWVSSAIYETSFKTPDGKRVFFHVVRDITERKNAEAEVQRQKDFLENVLESITQPFYIIDVNDYTIIMANSAAHFGQLTKKSKCYKLTHNVEKPCDTTLHPCPIEEIKRTKKPVIVEHEHLTERGGLSQVEIHGFPVFDNDGNIIQIIEYAIDITKRKQDEEKLKNNQEELEINSRNLEENVITLKVLLKHHEKVKEDSEKIILENINTHIFPYLEKIKVYSQNENQLNWLNIIEKNLNEIAKPFLSRFPENTEILSPSEIRVAKLVKEGKTAHEIADILLISHNTVREHKSHIRKKLGIKKKKINLRIFLQKIFQE